MASVDIHQAGEHQIILGDSLKDEANGNNALLDIKYNWLPKPGFEKKTGIISENNGRVDLKLGSKDDEYSYSGWQSDPSDQPQLVLIYDSERSVYVLEKLTASLNVNIKSASKVPADQIKRYAPLKRPNSTGQDNADASDGDLFDDQQDSSPDPSHPFDYRNFTSEAKQQAEKQAQGAGISTPLAGSRTPMSGLSSPMPRQSHLDTPPLAPIEIVTASDRKLEDYPRRRPVAQRPKTQRRPQTKASSGKTKALSQEVIIDSSDSDSDPPALPVKGKGHNRNVSNISESKSPQIRINDADIDSDSNSSVPQSSRKVEDHIPEADVDADVDMAGYAEFLEDDDEDDSGGKNADVADLDLEFEDVARSPSPPPIIAPKPKRKGSMKRRRPRSPSPPRGNDDYDDGDGGLAAELEAALEQEAQSDDNAGVGLGIAVAGRQDEESDISEEE